MNDEGKARAQQLAQVLKKAQIEAIYSTTCNRTWETAKPLSEELELAIRPYQSVPALAAIVQAGHAGKRVFVVSHSGMVEAIINALGGDGSACAISDEFDNLCVVNIEEPNQVEVLNLQYGRGSTVDLVVESLRYRPANPRTTDRVTFTVIVKNNGTDRADPSTLSLCIGRVERAASCHRDEVDALRADETWRLDHARYLSVAGDYRITATVDVDDTVVESNEQNNRRTANLTVSKVGCQAGDERYVRCRTARGWGFRRDVCVGGTWRRGRCQAGEIP